METKIEIEQIKQFLYGEICERRPYSASRMCEEVIKFIEQMEKQTERSHSEELIQLELLIKSQEELKNRGVLTNEGICYLNGLKTALKQFNKK
jgi:hypothetical protein